MGCVVLITGGGRSGKSEYARARAESAGSIRTFIATSPVTDPEIAERIRKHQAIRKDGGWRTIEEETDIPGAINAGAGSEVFLVDCLTLWINNLLYKRDRDGLTTPEEFVTERVAEIKEACDASDACFFFVTSETGMGIVPADPLTRLYRDLVGRCNQDFGAWVDEVVLVVSGIPIHIKKGRI